MRRAAALELADHTGDLRVRVAKGGVEVVAHAAEELVAPRSELREAAPVLVARGLRLLAQAQRFALLALERGAAGGQLD